MSQALSRSFKLVTVWLLVATVVFVATQWWQRRAAAMRFRADGDIVEIHRSADGQYHWPGRVNGRAVDFLVDTGASGTAISASLARELRLPSLGAVRSSTAGGAVTGQLVTADISLRGGVAVHQLRVAALPALGRSQLLGMDVLGRLNLQQRDGVLQIDPAPSR